MSGQEEMKTIVSDSIQIVEYVRKGEYQKINSGGYLNVSMLSAIDNQSLAAVRSGGPSVLSTLLHRGMASRHIGILWGGFNIQSVVNGTFDAGLIRNTFDQTKFYSNGASPVLGNASMAGAISLQNQFGSQPSTRVGISVTSAKNLNITFINKFKSQNYFHHLAFNRTFDRNEYSYKNGGVQLTQKRANFSLWSLNYEGHYIFSDRFDLTGGLWLQDADRDIPPTKTSVDILQEQKDVNHRGFLRGTFYTSPKSRIIVRTAYFDESLEYQAPGIFSLAESDVFNSAIDFIHDEGVRLSAQYRHDRVDASFFEPIHKRNTVAFLGDIKRTLNLKTEIGASIRPEWVDSNFQPLSLGVFVKRRLSAELEGTLKYTKGYTLPSFNDLYWPAGGNPDLKTERSHAIDLEFRYKYGTQKTNAIQFNTFINLIDDWIQWTPIEGFFEPVNQRKVRNLGFELQVKETFKLFEGTVMNVNLMYGFTDSRLVEHYLNPENEGKQTIFVPRHKITGQIQLIKDSWQLQLRPIYYSKRYDTVDNSSFTSGFFVNDIDFMKKIQLKESEIRVVLSVENSLNNDYENIRFYPMPLRIFRIGAQITL